MANFVKHTSCPQCGSKDNRAVYDDGSTYCFGCQTSTKPGGEIMDTEVVSKPSKPCPDLSGLPTTNIPDRAVSREVAEFFGVKMAVENGQLVAHHYPYTKNGELVAFKKRSLPKAFEILGDFNGVDLFGQSLFPSGGNKVIVVEGELDALAVAEAHLDKYGKIYPVVSLPSASGKAALLRARDWLRSFKEIVLFIDNDDAGQKILKEAATILGIEKVKVAQHTLKDASDVLTKQGKKAVLEAVWNAQQYSPAGIVVGEQIWNAILEHENKVSVPFPACLDGLNGKLKGMREGEITLFTSGTGSGKSTVVKEIILHLKETQDAKIGIISLEEGVADTAMNLIAMDLKVSRHSGDLDTDNFRGGYDKLFSDGQIVMLDHQGSVSDESLTDKIRYMAAMGCKYLFLDHITIAVSEGAEGLTGNEAVDKVMSDLLKIVKQHDVWLGVISHLRKAPSGGQSFEEGKLASLDDIKGSGSIKQISFDIIAFARNLVSDDEHEKNTIKLRVLKARHTGLTGNAGYAVYDNATGRLTHVDEEAMGFEIEL